jgi:quercetin dioxygenase-like cupin family protein
MQIRKAQDLPPSAVAEAPGVIIRVIKQADEAELRLLHLPPGTATPYHQHGHPHEVLVLSGTGTVRQASGERELAPDDLVSVPAHEPHSFIGGPGGLRFVCLDCLFD